ncbi:cyclic nucleotide-binding domain-containing protein [Flavobacteriaceae bacterium F89]|uniref:Cyclic nucleotide-binding domain-containing protein n=2 Tax=Cerina litoralis TaxID=2874477 RepID=A0AAE3JM40_9FLAO|nr:cyclic nucleotide-binding domain-containing protein [Cerina litoralis]
MYDKLIEHIQRIVPHTKSESQIIKDHFTQLQVKKKEHFLKQGYVCRTAGFIIEGCYRNYVISSEGKEINTSFGFENWWIGDVGSFVNQTPTQINAQFLEDTTLLTISAENYLSLMNKVPCF